MYLYVQKIYPIIIMVKSFSQIIDKQYKRSDPDFTNDCIDFFTENNKLNKTYLTNDEVSIFINKITKGKKSKSLISYYKKDANERIIILELLSRYHRIPYEQIHDIIECIVNMDVTNFEWILRSHNFSSYTRSFLKEKGYIHKNPLDGIINKMEATITITITITIEDINFAIIKVSHDITLEYDVNYNYNGNMKYIIEKNKIDNYFKHIVEIIKTNNLRPNFETISILNSNCSFNDKISEFMSCDVEQDIRILHILSLARIISPIFESYVSKFFEAKIIKNMNDVLFIFKNICVENFTIVMDYIDKFEIPYSFDALKLIVKSSEYEIFDDKNGGEYHQMIPINQPVKFEEKNYSLKRINLLLKFLDKKLSKQDWTFFMEYVCLCHDEILFDVMIKNNVNVNVLCLENACQTQSLFIINKLFDLKIIPTKKCFLNIIKEKNNEYLLFDLLVSNGLKVDDELIKQGIEYGFYITNLSTYGYDPSEKLYEICHELRNFHEIYLKQLQHIQNFEIYEAIRNKQNNGNIIEIIKSSNTTPDYIMYELALMTHSNDLISFFETEYNMKPTILSIIKLDDYHERLEHVKRYCLF